MGRRRKRQPWSRMRRKRKGSDDEENDDQESEEEETEEDDSDEDFKVEKTRKRRRNRNRERNSSDSSTSSSEDGEPNDDPCKHCGLPNHPELVRHSSAKYLQLLTVRSASFNLSFPFPQILLCDSCDSGYHTACLRPPLMIIPDGEWFCPPCQHVSPFRFQDSLYRKTQFWLFKYSCSSFILQKQLCDRLEEQLLDLDAALKKKERSERR